MSIEEEEESGERPVFIHGIVYENAVINGKHSHLRADEMPEEQSRDRHKSFTLYF